MNSAIPEVTAVVADHRGVTVQFRGDKVTAVLDFAYLKRVTVLHHSGTLLWQLDGPDFTVMLIPFGVPGESVLRRELQDLPGFNTHLLFSYLDDRADQEPPLVLWQV